MQGFVAFLTATFAVANIDKVTAAGGTHLGLVKGLGQHITQRHDAVPRRLVALPLGRPAYMKRKRDNGANGLGPV